MDDFLAMPLLIARWPVVALVLGLVILVRFREPISALIQHGTFKWGELSLEPLSRQAESNVPAKELGMSLERGEGVPGAEFREQAPPNPMGEAEALGNALQEEGGVGRAPFQPESLPYYFEQMVRRGTANLSPEDREKQLVASVAQLSTVFVFELLYQQIYGSQIALLQELNARDLSRDDARTFYERGVASAPELYKNDTLDRWLTWLRDNGNLIAIDDKTKELSLTIDGRAFLIYIWNRKYSPNKTG